MAFGSPALLTEQRRSHWVRLRTLVILRWTAIFGQVTAIAVSVWIIGLDINLGLCFMVIGTAVVANLISVFVYPENRRLTEREVTTMLLFDLLQLTALLFLTGGLHNPFSLLILAPVTIAASALRTIPTVIISAFAILAATLILWAHVPLHTVEGQILQMPQIFVVGFWLAIVIGVAFLGAYERRITSEINTMSEALLAAQMALEREQKISDLAGVVAATAHELGTPLATIKLTSGELIDELADNSTLREDAQLIHEQADRCRVILQSMGQLGKDDLHLKQTPLTALLIEAAEPHQERGIQIVHAPDPSDPSAEPSPNVRRRPEIIHGLRNLIQNAVDFAETTVWIDASWTEQKVTVRIVDDGNGYPPQVIGRIGDPFVRLRKDQTTDPDRPGYQGMGLGLFIAKTLLERTGAELSFTNSVISAASRPIPGTRCGAIVEVRWNSDSIRADAEQSVNGLGENQLNPA